MQVGLLRDLSLVGLCLAFPPIDTTTTTAGLYAADDPLLVGEHRAECTRHRQIGPTLLLWRIGLLLW